MEALTNKRKSSGGSRKKNVYLGTHAAAGKILLVTVFGRPGGSNGVVDAARSRGAKAAAIEAANVGVYELTGLSPVVSPEGRPQLPKKWDARPVIENVAFHYGGKLSHKAANKWKVNKLLRSLGVPGGI